MNNLRKSLSARCWLTSLGLLLIMLATAHFFPSAIFTTFAKLSALLFLICTVIFFSYLIYKATANLASLITITIGMLAIALWQSSWVILGAGLSFLAICFAIRYFGSQVKDSGRTLSIEEKWYWYKVHLFFSGFYTRYPEKPKK